MGIVWKMTLHLFAVFVILMHMIAFNEAVDVIKTEWKTGE